MTTRAAVYIRVSTSEQAEGGVSLDQQRALAVRYCEARGWDLVAEYQDVMSGTRDSRPALKRLEADAKGKGFSVVLVYRVDRLARSFRKAARVMGELGDHGVALVSMTENLDLTTPIGQSIFGLLAGWAEQESLNTGQRVSDAKRHQALSGVWQSSWVPLGYRYAHKGTSAHRLVVDEEWAPVVRRVFQMWNDGHTRGEIAATLNAEGLRTIQGAQWWPRTIYLIIQQEAYIGRVVTGKSRRKNGKRTHLPASERGRSAAAHEAIVDDATWERAQAILKEAAGLTSSQVRARGVSPWTGIIRCAGGDHALYMVPCALSAGGERRTRYKCAHVGCVERAGIPTAWLDGVLWGEIARALEQAHYQGVIRSAPPAAKSSPAREVKRQKERIERARAGYLAGLLTIERAQAEQAAAEARIEALLSEPEPNAPAFPVELHDAPGIWPHLEPAHKGKILRVLVESVTIGRDLATVRLLPFNVAGWPPVLVVAIKRRANYGRKR